MRAKIDLVLDNAQATNEAYTRTFASLCRVAYEGEGGLDGSTTMGFLHPLMEVIKTKQDFEEAERSYLELRKKMRHDRT